MNIKDFQNSCVAIVRQIDAKYGIKRNSHLSFAQLMEEIGELAKAINLPKLRNKKIDKINLREEFADVLLQLAILADINDVDFESAVKAKILELKKRHKI